MAAVQKRSEKLDIRLTPEAKRTLAQAANVKGRTVSEFVLDAALSKAAEVLPDQRQFFLNTEQWEKFLAALDAPPRPRPRLKRLLTEPSVLERRRK